MTLRHTSRSLSAATPTRAGALAIAAVMATAALSACGGSSSGTSASPTKTVTIAIDSDRAPTGYDPLLYANGQYDFFSAMYDSLFVTAQDGSIKPSLVTDFTHSKDNLKLTLTLRQGVTFSDGTTLDATLVKKNLDRRSDKDLTSYGVFAPGGSAEIKDVTAKDASTVVITFATPQATGETNLADTAGVIVGGKAVDDPETLKTTPDGSGPYTLDTAKTTKPSLYTLTKNAKAWNASTFAFDTVVFKPITDSQARANALASGQADVGQIDPATVDFVQSKQKIAKNGGTITGFPVWDKKGATAKPFGEVKVRQALSYAINRQELVDSLHKGAKPTANLFPAAAPGYDAQLDTEFAYNVDKAKQLLTEAGYGNGFSFNLTVVGQPNTDELAVQKMWEAIGVKVNYKIVTSVDAVFAAVATEPLGFGPFAIGNPLGFTQGVLVGGFMNLQHATDPKIDAALKAASGATGDAQTAALKDLSKAITTQGWFIPLFENYAYVAYNGTKVKAPAFAGTNSIFLLSSIQPAS